MSLVWPFTHVFGVIVVARLKLLDTHFRLQD